jgi:hypothetical protein
MDPDDQNGLGPGQDAPAAAPTVTGSATPTSTGGATSSGAGVNGGGANGSGINWNDFKPSNEGLTQLDIWKTLANILMYLGYAAAFLAFLVGLILWVFGHKIGGRHLLDEAKTMILRAMAVGLILGSAGALWNWLMTQ